MKVIRWLRSRPLARVRRNLATRRRVGLAQAAAGLSDEFKASYHRKLAGLRQDRVVLYDGPIRSEDEALRLWRDRGILTGQGWEERAAAIDRLIEAYPQEAEDGQRDA